MADQIPFLSSQDVHEARATMPALIWDGDASLRINDISFRLSYDIGELKKKQSSERGFILGKPRHMVERAVDIAARRQPKKIFEMGILRGGSVVLYDLIFRPARIMAIDHAPERIKELDEYIVRYGKTDTIRPYYGVDQANRSAMEILLNAEFPERDIDLIIDDASHLYFETRQAFNICFPFLAPGGLYVIEDWAWAHWAGDLWQGRDSHFRGKPAMSNLLIELFILSASRSDLIENLFIDHNMVVVRKGYGTLPNERFDISEHLLLRGKTFKPLL